MVEVPAKIFKCPRCDRSFFDKRGLGGHLWLVHKEKSGLGGRVEGLSIELEKLKESNRNNVKILKENLLRLRCDLYILSTEKDSINGKISMIEERLKNLNAFSQDMFDWSEKIGEEIKDLNLKLMSLSKR